MLARFIFGFVCLWGVGFCSAQCASRENEKQQKMLEKYTDEEGMMAEGLSELDLAWVTQYAIAAVGGMTRNLVKDFDQPGLVGWWFVMPGAFQQGPTNGTGVSGTPHALLVVGRGSWERSNIKPPRFEESFISDWIGSTVGRISGKRWNWKNMLLSCSCRLSDKIPCKLFSKKDRFFFRRLFWQKDCGCWCLMKTLPFVWRVNIVPVKWKKQQVLHWRAWDTFFAMSKRGGGDEKTLLPHHHEAPSFSGMILYACLMLAIVFLSCTQGWSFLTFTSYCCPSDSNSF